MKKNLISWIVASIVVMLALPWALVGFAKSDSGMVACLILFFAVDPIYFIIIGIFSGKNIRSLWYMPPVSAILYLLGAWICFDTGEQTFLIYALFYLGLGMAAMFVSKLINGKNVDKAEEDCRCEGKRLHILKSEMIVRVVHIVLCVMQFAFMSLSGKGDLLYRIFNWCNGVNIFLVPMFFMRVIYVPCILIEVIMILEFAMYVLKAKNGLIDRKHLILDIVLWIVTFAELSFLEEYFLNIQRFLELNFI